MTGLLVDAALAVMPGWLKGLWLALTVIEVAVYAAGAGWAIKKGAGDHI